MKKHSTILKTLLPGYNASATKPGAASIQLQRSNQSQFSENRFAALAIQRSQFLTLFHRIRTTNCPAVVGAILIVFASCANV